jgi:chorismate mutase
MISYRMKYIEDVATIALNHKATEMQPQQIRRIVRSLRPLLKNLKFEALLLWSREITDESIAL